MNQPISTNMTIHAGTSEFVESIRSTVTTDTFLKLELPTVPSCSNIDTLPVQSKETKPGESVHKNNTGRVYPIFPASAATNFSQLHSNSAKRDTLSKEEWFKPCSENIESPKAKKPKTEAFFSPHPIEDGEVEEEDVKVADGSATVGKNTTSRDLCEYSLKVCKKEKLKGFQYCHKHVLEDKNSPFKKCSFVGKADGKRCQNPAPKLQNDKKSYCLVHAKTAAKKKANNKKKKKKKKTESPEYHPDEASNKKKAANLSVPLNEVSTRTRDSSKRPMLQESSSDEEEFSFFTDSVQVKAVDCTWHGNQASDAESTDSEDDNPLNHAGTWTLEEAVRICKDKMIRLRNLYALQYKRLNYNLRERRREMLSQYDMDPVMLSKVHHHQVTGDTLYDYKVDMSLTNYQRLGGVEALAEKAMKDKRNKGMSLAMRRSDLPRCTSNVDGRCHSRSLPYSKFCLEHICSDTEQYLYAPCSYQPKNSDRLCNTPVGQYEKLARCRLHSRLLPTTSSRGWDYLQSRKDQNVKDEQKEEDLNGKADSNQQLMVQGSISNDDGSCSELEVVDLPSEDKSAAPKHSTVVSSVEDATLNSTKEINEPSSVEATASLSPLPVDSKDISSNKEGKNTSTSEMNKAPKHLEKSELSDGKKDHTPAVCQNNLKPMDQILETTSNNTSKVGMTLATVITSNTLDTVFVDDSSFGDSSKRDILGEGIVSDISRKNSDDANDDIIDVVNVSADTENNSAIEDEMPAQTAATRATTEAAVTTTTTQPSNIALETSIKGIKPAEVLSQVQSSYDESPSTTSCNIEELRSNTIDGAFTSSQSKKAVSSTVDVEKTEDNETGTRSNEVNLLTKDATVAQLMGAMNTAAIDVLKLLTATPQPLPLTEVSPLTCDTNADVDVAPTTKNNSENVTGTPENDTEASFSSTGTLPLGKEEVSNTEDEITPQVVSAEVAETMDVDTSACEDADLFVLPREAIDTDDSTITLSDSDMIIEEKARVD